MVTYRSHSIKRKRSVGMARYGDAGDGQWHPAIRPQTGDKIFLRKLIPVADSPDVKHSAFRARVGKGRRAHL